MAFKTNDVELTALQRAEHTMLGHVVNYLEEPPDTLSRKATNREPFRALSARSTPLLQVLLNASSTDHDYLMTACSKLQLGQGCHPFQRLI